jgi:hypothetical protein
VKTRDEIVEMLTAAFGRSRLSGHSDIRVVVEKMADQLVVINDEHHRQIALAKATFDAEIDALKREMASAKLNFDGALKKLCVGPRSGLSDRSTYVATSEHSH